MWTVTFLHLFIIGKVFSDNTPSLLTTNATIAIVLDREYLDTNYEIVKSEIAKYFVYAKREVLKHGGVNVQFFSWTSINIKRDFAAILSIAPCDDMWNLFRIADSQDIAFLSITEPDCPRLPRERAVSIPVTRAGEELPQVLLDLRSARAYSWKEAIVLYDGTMTRDMVTRVITSLTGHTSLADVTAAGMALAVMKLEAVSTEAERIHEATSTLSDLPHRQLGSNFIVIVSSVYVEPILQAARALEMLHPASQWLFAVADTDTRLTGMDQHINLLKEGDNIAFVYNWTSNEGLTCTTSVLCHGEELLEAFCTALDAAVQEETTMAGQLSEEEWETVRPAKADRRDFLLRDINRHLNELGQCNNCSRWRFEAADTWGRSLSGGRGPQLLTAGHWRPLDGPSFTDELFPHNAHKFRGRNMPVVTFHNPPWQIIIKDPITGKTTYGGLIFDIINELSSRLNFTYTVHELEAHASADDDVIQTTGYVTEEAARAVKNGKALLVAVGFTVTPDKNDVNFTIPVSVQKHTFVVARPRELSRALLFINPFTKATWASLAAAVVLVGPILCFFARFTPAHEARKQKASTLHSCTWYVYGALLQQGGMFVPTADSARLVVGAWWLMVLIMATTYCGNLVAFLTFPKIDIPIKTFSEMLEQKETITWSADAGTLLVDYLAESRDSTMKGVYDGLKLYDRLTDEVIDSIRSRKHIYIGWKIRIAYMMKKNLIDTGNCDFAFGIEEFLDEQIAMVMARGSPYLEMINDEIFRMHQMGLIEKWLRQYLPKRDRCWKVGQLTEVNNHTVNLDDMQGSFFVLFVGFFLGLIFLIGEKLIKLWTSSRKAKLTPFVT